jgi:hypothetical protein
VKIEPLDDRLLVEPIEEEAQRTAGGIYLPDTAKEKPRVARVAAVGTDDDLRVRAPRGRAYRARRQPGRAPPGGPGRGGSGSPRPWCRGAAPPPRR